MTTRPSFIANPLFYAKMMITKHAILLSLFLLLIVKDAIGKKDNNWNKNNKNNKDPRPSMVVAPQTAPVSANEPSIKQPGKNKEPDYYYYEKQEDYYDDKEKDDEKKKEKEYYEEDDEDDEYYEEKKESSTLAPSSAPKGSPIYHPSKVPTQSPLDELHESPVSTETEPPTATNDGVTAKPVMTPVSSSSLPPTTENSMVRISLPPLTFRFSNVPQDLNHEYFKQAIEDFVNITIQSQAMRPSHLDLVVLISSGRRRLRETAGITAIVKGDVYYDSPSSYPTAERLTEVIYTYFANWGDTDLREHLELSRDVRLEVFLNESRVEKVNMNPKDTTIAADDDDDGIPTWVLIIGLVVGCLALATAISLFCWQRGIMNKDKKNKNRTTTSKKEKSQKTMAVAAGDDDDNRSSSSDDSSPHSISGIVSLEDSIYTSTTEVRKEKAYDAKRLDTMLQTPTSSSLKSEDEEIMNATKSFSEESSSSSSPTVVKEKNPPNNHANRLEKFLLESNSVSPSTKSSHEQCLEKISSRGMNDNRPSQNVNKELLGGSSSPKPYDEIMTSLLPPE
mmetsp:Transcript_16275/g.23933  ORF Transcript_16275/g.23933 Transcript_16275/m.23933 type:complete len:563 (-) Transcript_16275:98-1786(-)